MPVVMRTDHVGSLIRPAPLLEARAAYREGRIPLEALRAAEDEAVLEALALQQAAGLEVFTDGEFRRDAWQTPISQAVDGFANEYPVQENRLADGTVVRLEMHTKPVVAKLQRRRRLLGVDVAFLKRHAPGPFKVTLPSPSYTARSSYARGVTERAYPTVEALQQDTVAILRAEVEALAADGVSYLQLDEGFTGYVRPGWLDALRSQGIDPEQALAADIAADNACYDAARARGMTTAMHLCRGSRTNARNTGSYDWLAERLFDQLHVDRFLLEYDSEAAGGFEPLRFVPPGKVAVLGLVTTKDARLEAEDELVRRVEAAARFCPLERLAISPQCGFQGAANADGARMTVDDQQRKLELVVRVARRIWG